MEHMVSGLLLLIKAQEPILPTASNRINVMEQVKTVVGAHRDMAQRRGIDIEIDGDESLDINGEGEQIQAVVLAEVARGGRGRKAARKRHRLFTGRQGHNRIRQAERGRHQSAAQRA